MRILIAEEALQRVDGHWPSYIGGIAGGLRAAGDHVDVLAHRECGPDLACEVGAVPYFSRNCWIDPRSQGAIGGLRHNAIFRRELARWLKASGTEYDWVCALTMRLQHLLAFALLSRDARIPDKTRFLLLFVQGFGHYTGPDSPSRFPVNASTLLARLCFRILRPAVRRGRVVIAGETSGMRDELQRFTGLPAACFPHPVPPPPALSDWKTGDDCITLSCPGFARHEKGADLLQEAILRILGDPEHQRLRFVMQWPKPFCMPDGSLAGPDPRLLESPRVEFINESLDRASYEGLLQRSDFVLLPYRRVSYHNRVSRVAIEAASRGIPMVYMSGTWSREVADLAGCGVAIEHESEEAVLRAIQQAARGFAELKRQAAAGAPAVARHFSLAAFRQLLDGGVPS